MVYAWGVTLTSPNEIAMMPAMAFSEPTRRDRLVHSKTFEQMKSEKRWVVADRKEKIPMDPNHVAGSGINASSTDSSTWATYDVAENRANEDGNLVLGFVLGGDWCGVDLDHVEPKVTKDVTAIESPLAREIVARSVGVSHLEWSPSGDGIHAIFRTPKPDGLTCRKKLGRNNLGIEQMAEFYGDGRFFTVTKDEVEIPNGYVNGKYGSDSPSEAAQSIGTLAFRKGPTVRTNVKTVAWGTSQVDQYVSTIIQQTAASSGERNSKMFSIAGNIAKKVDYDPNETIRLCRQVNSACFDPPLDDYELFQVVQSSLKNGTPRIDTPYVSPYLVEEFTPPAGLIERLNTVSDDYGKSFVDHSEWESVPGFIGEYIRYVKDNQCGYQPDLALAGALTCLSAIIGGRVECDGTVPNVMAVGLAPSGGGKEFSRSLTADVLERSDNEQRSGPEHLSSGEGLVSALAVHGPQLFQLDEAAELFAEIGTTSGIASRTAKFMKEAYSKAGRSWRPNARADSDNNIKIDYPYASIYFTTTPDRWWGSFPAENVADGLLGRCLVFEAEGYVQSNGKRYKPPQANDKLLGFACAWNDDSKMLDEKLGNWVPDQWQTTAAAFDRLQGLMDKIERKAVNGQPTEVDALWMRSRDRIMKVALLIACSQKGPNSDKTIEEWHMSLAIDLLKKSNYRVTFRLKSDLASSEEQKVKLKVLKTLEEFGTLRKGQLYKKGVRCDAKLRDIALKTLIEEGEIEQRVDGMYRRIVAGNGTH